MVLLLYEEMQIKSFEFKEGPIYLWMTLRKRRKEG